jgi:hypothetical protein
MTLCVIAQIVGMIRQLQVSSSTFTGITRISLLSIGAQGCRGMQP